MRPLINHRRRRVAGEGFRRFCAKRVMEPSNMGHPSFFGSIIYFSIFGTIPWTPTAICLVLALAGTCPWSYVLYKKAPEVYLQWREHLWILHFALHHAVAPWILKMGLGVDFKPKIIITNPFKLLFAMVVSATLPWHALNALVYRPSLQYFYVSQPLILLASLPIDLDNCAWAARADPKGSAKTFGLLLSYGRVMSAMSTPGATALASHNEVCDGYKDGYCECVHLTIFSYIVIGYLLPCAMLHQLERYAWCAYLDAEPAMLTWQHGPSVDEIRDVVRDLKEEERVPSAELDMSSTSRSWQRLLTAFVVLAVLWQSLEIILYSPLLVQTFAHFRQRHT